MASSTDGIDKAIAWLAAGFTLVTGLLASLSGAPGSLIDRLVRNRPGAVFTGFLLCILAIGCATVASLIDSKVWRKGIVGGGALAFLAGLVILLLPSTLHSTAPERPSVIASLKTEGGLSLEGTAKAGGLKSSEEVFVSVYGLVLSSYTKDGAPQYDQETIYSSQTGPDRGGLADLSFAIPLPGARYSTLGISASIDQEPAKCDFTAIRPAAESTGNQGCLLIRVPTATRQPDVFASMSGASTMTAEVHAQSLRFEDRIGVRVFGLARRKANAVLYHAVLSPNPEGDVGGSFDLSFGDKYSKLCVQATTHPAVPIPSPVESDGARRHKPAGGRCPVKDTPLTGWAKVRTT